MDVDVTLLAHFKVYVILADHDHIHIALSRKHLIVDPFCMSQMKNMKTVRNVTHM